MAQQPKTCRAVPANRGLEAKYRKALQRLIAEMHASVEYWLTAAYRKNPPRMAALVEQAQDASVIEQKKRDVYGRRNEYMAKYGPSAKVKRVLDELARRWTDRFNEYAPKLAEAYLKGMFKASDSAFRLP